MSERTPPTDLPVLRERAYEVVVVETMAHAVYVNAKTKAEAREKARLAENWIDDMQDFTQVAPITVRGSVQLLGDAL